MQYLWQVIIHFVKNFFMGLCIVKRRRSFVYPSVNQSLYTFTLEQRGLQLRNFVQRYWRGFWRRPRSFFFKIRFRFFWIIFFKYFLRFYYKVFFYFTILRLFASNSKSTAPKFSTEILNTDFEKTLKRCFRKLFWIIYRDTSKSRIFVRVTSHGKIYEVSRNLYMFLQ